MIDFFIFSQTSGSIVYVPQPCCSDDSLIDKEYGRPFRLTIPFCFPVAWLACFPKELLQQSR